MEYYKTHSINVSALYYDFIPTQHSSNKSLWVQLRSQPPPTLRIGTTIILESLDRNLGLPKIALRVTDIIGTRVSLISDLKEPVDYRDVKYFNESSDSKGWHPSNHSSHWGYALKDWVDTLNQSKNWTFGSGESVAMMIW